MVATAEQLCDTAAGKGRRCGTSVSSFTSCVKFKNRISVPSSFVSLCLGGETRHLRGVCLSYAAVAMVRIKRTVAGFFRSAVLPPRVVVKYIAYEAIGLY